MLIDYDLERLEAALDDFQNSTSVIIAFYDSNRNQLGKGRVAANFCKLLQTTAEGKKRCAECDKKLFDKCTKSLKLEITECHAGLIDSAVPIVFEGEIVAYLMLGQIKKGYEFEYIDKKVADLNLDEAALFKAYKEIPFSTPERIKSVANIAVMLTEYIVFNNLIKARYGTHTDSAVKFIEANLGATLSADIICKNINISKSTLYYSFKNQFGCTVNEYINRRRIEKAKQLLSLGNLRIEEISENVGFENHTYFCKVFKALTGTTALKYKKSLQENK